MKAILPKRYQTKFQCYLWNNVLFLTPVDFQVWYADAFQIPMLLKEIGRLREIAFRNVGEGTGKTEDLDQFDSYYQHLFLWDTEAQIIIGDIDLEGLRK